MHKKIQFSIAMMMLLCTSATAGAKFGVQGGVNGNRNSNSYQDTHTKELSDKNYTIDVFAGAYTTWDLGIFNVNVGLIGVKPFGSIIETDIQSRNMAAVSNTLRLKKKWQITGIIAPLYRVNPTFAVGPELQLNYARLSPQRNYEVKIQEEKYVAKTEKKDFGKMNFAMGLTGSVYLSSNFGINTSLLMNFNNQEIKPKVIEIGKLDEMMRNSDPNAIPENATQNAKGASLKNVTYKIKKYATLKISAFYNFN